MSSEPTSLSQMPDHQLWAQLEHEVDELSRLAREELSPQEFHQQLLARSIRAVNATGGAVWARLPGGQLRLEAHQHLPAVFVENEWALLKQHGLLVDEVVRAGQVRLVPPGSSASDAGNPTPGTLVIAPFLLDEQPLGALELLLPARTPETASQGARQFAEVAGELAGDYHRNRRLRELTDRESLWGQYERFLERVHRHLETNAVAFTLANEGRRVIGCDRLSVAVARRGKVRIRAVSGVDDFNRRARQVHLLEAACQAVVRTGQPLWIREDSVDLPPQLQTLVDDYLSTSPARLLAVVPLVPPVEEDQPESSPPLGALAVEHFEAIPAEMGLEQRVSAIARHGATALEKAIEHESLPLYPLLRVVGASRWFVAAERLPRTLWALVAVIAVVALLILIPADFQVEARGQLQPEFRRDVFAPADAQVENVLVQHGQMVQQGQTVARLSSRDLEFQLTELAGRRQTLIEQLNEVRAARLTGANDRQSGQRPSELSAREEELQQSINALDEQRQILRRQQAELELASPIAGQVVTWNLEQRLHARPVTRGQSLLTIADPDSQWVLELDVPDDRIGYVLEASAQQQQPLPVTFILATDPRQRFQGRIQDIAAATQTDAADQQTVEVTVSVDREAIPQRRPGATVLAHITCGRRSIGYVWLHDLIDAVRKWVLF